ncbi:MAG: ornithine cyclodeaminase family protein [Thermoanaerobaculia bacterium]|nr:ornithine cyclodeaminase family protein [Thermoanaerobaculia bacterium]
MKEETSPSQAVRIVTERELRSCVDLDTTAFGVVEQAFTWLAETPVEMPPIQHLSITERGEALGDVDIKSAFVPGIDLFAVKIASGFASNLALGLPSGNGLMVLLDSRTGQCRAVLLDNGYLTDLRTALAGAVAAKHLAPAHVETVGVLGTGRQAELQARALLLARPYSKLLICGRTRSRAETLASLLAPKLEGVAIEVVAEAREVVERSQCVVTTTAAREPLVFADWLHPGLHLTAMGSDVPGKQELDPEVLLRADLCVVDRRSQSERLGELQHVEPALRASLTVLELGSLTSGRHPGRTEPGAITVCDLTGTGVQDTAIAVHALHKTQAAGRGSEIELG